MYSPPFSPSCDCQKVILQQTVRRVPRISLKGHIRLIRVGLRSGEKEEGARVVEVEGKRNPPLVPRTTGKLSGYTKTNLCCMYYIAFGTNHLVSLFHQ